jgi:hypothetical protein
VSSRPVSLVSSFLLRLSMGAHTPREEKGRGWSSLGQLYNDMPAMRLGFSKLFRGGFCTFFCMHPNEVTHIEQTHIFSNFDRSTGSKAGILINMGFFSHLSCS